MEQDYQLGEWHIEFSPNNSQPVIRDSNGNLIVCAMTVLLPVLFPDCHSSDIIRHGKSQTGKQRYLCQNPDCLRRTFVLNIE